jgi:AhpD family alkylhydroperoxidase
MEMEARLDYARLAPEGIAKMRALEHYLNTAAGLELAFLELVRLRVSWMNGCEYCIGKHTAELQRLNQTAERIARVAEWRGSALYTPREQAALAWAEALTNIQDGHAPDAVYAQMLAHFTEVETVNLTLAISSMNAWNRIAIGLGAHAGRASVVAG